MILVATVIGDDCKLVNWYLWEFEYVYVGDTL